MTTIDISPILALAFFAPLFVWFVRGMRQIDKEQDRMLRLSTYKHLQDLRTVNSLNHEIWG